MKTRHFQMMATLAVGLAMTCVMTTSCSVEDNPVDDGVVIENENGKEALDLGGGTPMVGAESGYIYAAKVLGCTKKSDIQKLISKYQNEGWQIIDKDLNADARGKYIYLAVKKCDLNSAEQGSAVTDFLLTDEYQDFLDKDGKRYVNVPFDGDSNFKGDLNAGAGGATIRLFFTKYAFNNLRVVTKVKFDDDINRAVGLNASGEGYDLNTKTKKKGEKIYMHMETKDDVARWDTRSWSNTQCFLGFFIGDTKNIKTVSIPLKFDELEIKEAAPDDSTMRKDGILPDLEEQNYFFGTMVTYAKALTMNTGFKQVNVVDVAGHIVEANALPESIEEIAPAGFKGMSIEEISLPYGLKEIRNRAFMDCSNLKTIYFGCADSLKSANEKKWKAIPKGDDWNKNVNADFKVVFKGK